MFVQFFFKKDFIICGFSLNTANTVSANSSLQQILNEPNFNQSSADFGNRFECQTFNSLLSTIFSPEQLPNM